jgi:hypothetical protein
MVAVRAIVTSVVDGLTAVIGIDGNRIMVPKGDSNQIVDAIYRLLTQKAFRERI